MYQYKINKIKRVVDGDTVDVEIDLGFGVSISQRVRLKGINAAETKTKDSVEKNRGLSAKKWLSDYLNLNNEEWTIETTKEDKYGRILGVLHLKGSEVSLNQKMLNEGIAVFYEPQ
jgi:micrococcal nuclease